MARDPSFVSDAMSRSRREPDFITCKTGIQRTPENCSAQVVVSTTSVKQKPFNEVLNMFISVSSQLIQMLTIGSSGRHTVKQVTPETYATRNASEQESIRKAVAAAQRKGSSDFS
jgi:hypothetical protein